jgi:carboxyl-terminal processing protease
MKSRIWVYLAAAFIAIILLTGTFSTGIFLGGVLAADNNTSIVEELPLLIPSRTPGGDGASAAAGTPADLDQLFAPFWESWEIVHDQYVDQPVNDELLMQGAIHGMMEALGDQHTSYMDPQQFRQANIPLEGEYEGIGAWVDPTAEYLTIVSPMPDSPAEKAGLQPGDQIIAIDGDDMTGIDGELAIRRVLGPAGTQVTLTIRREELEEPFDVTLERAHIVVPSVESEMLEGNVAYIKLFTFGDDTAKDLREALQDVLANRPVGLVLDLRNNGGGFLRTAIDVSSEFIGDGVIMYEEYGDGSRDTFEAERGGLATDIPLVVLINEGTASASEILAGAVQDHERGQLVGVTSFGKGSVQVVTPLADDKGALRVTIARWLTPDGRTIHEQGLEPDVVVELTEEDLQAERDPQLDKAVELLTNPN